MKQNLNINERSVYPLSSFQPFFRIQAANITRSKTPFTLIFLSMHSFKKEQLHSVHQVSDFLLSLLRDSDLLFQMEEEPEWVIMLSHSGQLEASYFLKRMFQRANDFDSSWSFCVSICEIGNGQASWQEAIHEGEMALQEALKEGPSSVHTVNLFQQREVEVVKVSILQNDPIIKQIFLSLLQRMAFDEVELDIKVFEDGEQFLQSSWYQSGHTHVVMMDEILPKKNGLEVLHALRQMPNEKKYLICMLSNQKRESDMIYAFEQGVDEYITKPFNLKLIEARLKRLLKRRA